MYQLSIGSPYQLTSGSDSVGDLEDITPEALAFARSRNNPKPLEEHTLEVPVKIHLRVAPGVSVEDFITNMSMRVLSQTPGITVAGFERA